MNAELKRHALHNGGGDFISGMDNPRFFPVYETDPNMLGQPS